MKDIQYKIVNGAAEKEIPAGIQKMVEEFTQKCRPIEKDIYVLSDEKTGAFFVECHLIAGSLMKLCTIDVPLDPDEEEQYRANRDIVEDNVAFSQMKADAKEKRTFSNIVGEYEVSHNPKYPIKIIGGQHRYVAIKEAYTGGISTHHGFKIYFELNKEQRLDVQLISNTNIAVSSDLYDRLQETAAGPQLRQWCQKVGFLDDGQDFSSKRDKGSPMNVRSVRSFVLSYYAGGNVDIAEFENTDTTPILCRTGRPDSDWEQLRKDKKDIWVDTELQKAAEEFVLLDDAQRMAIENVLLKDKNKAVPYVYAEKALTFSIMTAWAYVAGILRVNKVRLQRHYDLRNSAKEKDPLNAEAMAKGRHKTDPENYRGLGTRNDAKERGRCVELFYLQAESGKGITPAVIDAAIKRHYTKQAKLEQIKAEKKV
ncbi:MAG: hypothetical protein A2Z28_06350 [Chloroflexi bacterium RBG_16_51_9]|nr:MAG: hypothetical protein A2Z28_06350 [Chloroflexi bacterium RBG_16_51_9]